MMGGWNAAGIWINSWLADRIKDGWMNAGMHAGMGWWNAAGIVGYMDGWLARWINGWMDE